jgi:hypothetical protein
LDFLRNILYHEQCCHTINEFYTTGSVNSIVENIGEIFVESAKITFGTFCSTKSRPRQKKSEDFRIICAEISQLFCYFVSI